MRQPERVLICALSGRALAQAARAAGFAPIVLDAFADLDTRDAAVRCARIPIDRSWRFRRGALLAAALRLAPPPVPLVWGSGFERSPELLGELAAGRELLGCAPSDVRAVKDPRRWDERLDRLGIGHPEIRLAPPEDPAGWLCKRAGAAGGGHVRRATSRLPRGRGWYWQRWCAGLPVSALVVGNGRSAKVLACSRAIVAPRSGRRFRFGGMVTPARITEPARATLERAALEVARSCGVRGLASVDALVAGDAVQVLELNPRPGGSLDACAAALGVELFALHVAACRDQVLPETTPPGVAAGSLILWAERALAIPRAFAWPEWTADRSPPGTPIPAGAPICTILARHETAEGVEPLLRARADRLNAMLVGAGFACERRPLRYDGGMMTSSPAAAP